jgi:AraC-like DNA-binding protein
MRATLAHSHHAPAGGVFSASRSETLPSDASVARGAAFTTTGLPLSEQFDVYREFCAPVIDVFPNEGSCSGFEASCEMWVLGPFAVRRIHTPAGHFARHAAQIRRDGLDHWVFNVVRRGEQEARTTTSSLKTGAGVLSVFSLAGAYEARRTDVDWLGLFVPRGAIPAIDEALNHNEHRAMDNALGRVFAAYLGSLADELSSTSHDELPALVQATQALLGAVITSATAVLDSNDTAFNVPRMRNIREYIDSNLCSWTLHAGRICKMAGASRSNLYRMFEPYGGVVRYIQQQRLRRAHERLADPTCTRTIKLIANDYCFSDSSTFGRAFRQEFGYSPTDLRRHAGTGRNALRNWRTPRLTAAGGGWGVLYNSCSSEAPRSPPSASPGSGCATTSPP